MNKSSSEYIKDISKEYSIYVCQNRAIPSVTDGLKNGQRQMLWVVRNEASKIKTISLAGSAIKSNLYLHGDTSAADTISFMAGPYINNVPYIQGIGNFGTRVMPREMGAARYTYIKKCKATEQLIYSDLDIVPLKENYDGSTYEPITFLPIIPTVLLNGISGIAVGWSTDILSHNLDDLINGCMNVLDDKKISRIKPFYSKYDVDIENIEGNSWYIKGKVDIVNFNTVRVIELPPDISLEKFRNILNDLEDDKKIRSYTDKSTKNINITINFKRGAIKGWSRNKIINFLKLKSKKTQRIVVIDWDGESIRQYKTPEELIIDFTNWRLGWYKTRYENLLAKTEYELRFQQALLECFKQKLPDQILKLKNRVEVKEKVIVITKQFRLDSDQIEKIVTLPSFRWSIESLQEVKDRIIVLDDLVKKYKKIIKHESLRKEIYREELQALKKIKF